MKLLLFLTFFSLPLWAELDPTEKKLIRYIDANLSASKSFLEKLVNINSGTRNIRGVRLVGNILKRELANIGFYSYWVNVPKKMRRAGHLFAVHKSKKRTNKMLIVGHLDTVFNKRTSFRKLIYKGGTAHGPGVADMKGGLTVILYALKALKEVNSLRDANITIAFLGDKEDPGNPMYITRKDLVKASHEADFSLGFESAGDQFNRAIINRRGYSKWFLKVTGKSGPAAEIFNEKYGAGANFALADILSRLYYELKGVKNFSFNAGLVAGGKHQRINNKNIVSRAKDLDRITRTALAAGELRTFDLKQRDNIQDKMQKIVAKTLPNTSAKLTFKEYYPPMGPTSENKKLLKIFSQVSEDLGYGDVDAVDLLEKAPADINFVAEHSYALDGLGPLGFSEHTKGEYTDMIKYTKVIKRTAILLYRLIRADK